MNVSKWFGVLVVGGGAITTLACGGSDDTDDTGSGVLGSGGESGDAGTASGGAAGAVEPATGGAAGAAGECTCDDNTPMFCDGICCMWMFGADQPCCDKL
jgi:hypothetical protein